MARSGYNNPPISSTGAGLVAAPSTATLMAELDSTQLGTFGYPVDFEQVYGVWAILGASTTAVWKIEHVTSTALAGALQTAFLYTPTGQSGEYTVKFKLQKNSRIRVRLDSTAANATAFLQAIAEA